MGSYPARTLHACPTPSLRPEEVSFAGSGTAVTPSACPSVHAPRINAPRIRRRRQKLRASAPCARPGPDRILFTSRPGRCCRRPIFPLFVCFSVLLFIACGLPISWCSFSRRALSAHTGGPATEREPPAFMPTWRTEPQSRGRPGRTPASAARGWARGGTKRRGSFPPATGSKRQRV